MTGAPGVTGDAGPVALRTDRSAAYSFMSNFALWGRLVLLIGFSVGMAACTASKDITQAQRQLRQVEDFREVDMDTLTKPLGEYRKAEEDEVLFHLEHGMLEHFQQEWSPSSTHFRQAQRAIEENYTKSINRNLQSMLVNDLQLPYRGEAYEDVYLNVVKCLNYLHQDDLEGAMVEARKVTHDLEMLSDRYQGLAESVQRDTAQVAVKKVDKKLEDVDLLSGDEETPVEIQQNSALGRFLTMVLYAKQGQRDDARVERQKLRAALEDQGHTDFLDALSQVAAATEDSDANVASASKESTTSLRLRVTPRDTGTPPPLQFHVNGRQVQTVDTADMQRTDGQYSVRLTGVPAARGDSISVQPTTRLRRPLRVEVWSDSAQYRGALEGRRDRAAFALGHPRIPPSNASPGHGNSAGKRRTDWIEDTPLQPVRLTYALTRATDAEPQQRTVKRVIEPAPRGTPAWRVVEQTESGFGGAKPGRSDTRLRTDTMHLAQSSLALRRYSHHSEQGGRMVVRQHGDALVETESRWRRQPTRVERSTPAYGEGMGMQMALATRSLSVGKRVLLPVYVSAHQSVQTVEAQVTGTDSIATPAGTFSVYVVRVQSPLPSQGTTTLYLQSSMPHHLVQSQAQVPIQREGRADTLTFKRTLAQVEPLETPVPTVASQREEEQAEPPQDPPSIAVSNGATAPDPAASTGIVPTPQQLTQPDTYNTLLMSFSGRAPKKRERSFTFSFTIRDEEYQLDFAIPVLDLSGTEIDRVRALAAGDTIRVPMIEEMQQVSQAMFEQKKSVIYTRAVIRAFLKAAATKGAEEIAESQGGQGAAWLVKQAGQMASGYVAEADTRGWQTMPGFAYATAANLPSGTQEVTFEFLSPQGTVLKRRTRSVEVGGPRDLALAESIYLK